MIDPIRLCGQQFLDSCDGDLALAFGSLLACLALAAPHVLNDENTVAIPASREALVDIATRRRPR